eukprot:gnl/Spiro4/16184_TR8700_c0_g1_i1.p1 gnl/Spiro4/16184_TR8700_c0_g1~~gnl/Spiro4/16184_TR8700_c0_g1_i1.p1  ORF type:complete len:107 (+),score=16.83 gnl/Spiro4/16184_TR8700_c0_g1_i1:62-382(+)
MRDRVARSRSLSKSAAGKHGATKISIVAKDLMTDRTLNEMFSSTSTVTQPSLFMSYGDIIAMTGDEVVVMDRDTREFSAKLPTLNNDLAAQITSWYSDEPTGTRST